MTGSIDVYGMMEILLQKGKAEKFSKVVARRNDDILITTDSVLAAICKNNNIQICELVSKPGWF